MARRLVFLRKADVSTMIGVEPAGPQRSPNRPLVQEGTSCPTIATNRDAPRGGVESAAPPTPLKLLTVREAAEYARVSIQTVRRWIKVGHIKTYRAGRQIRIDESDLISFLSGQ